MVWRRDIYHRCRDRSRLINRGHNTAWRWRQTIIGSLHTRLRALVDGPGPHRLAGASAHSLTEVCGLRTRISADPDPQIFSRTRTVKQTHLLTRTIRGSKATSIVCTTNLEGKCQCTVYQFSAIWELIRIWSLYIVGYVVCKKACLTVWGPRHCLLDTV